MTRFAIACVVWVAACSKAPTDDCHRAADVMVRALGGAPMPGGKSADDLRDIVIGECKKDPDAFKKDPDMQCVLAAKTEADEDACLKKGFDDYAKKSKKTEASLQLNRIAKAAKRIAIEKSAFPIGTAKMLPASPDPLFKGCCGGKSVGSTVDNKCPVTKDWATDPVWQALEFSPDEPSQYRYTYASTDGKSFTATAVGDLDCDNEEATFTLTGKLDASGAPSTSIVEPPAGTY